MLNKHVLAQVSSLRYNEASVQLSCLRPSSKGDPGEGAGACPGLPGGAGRFRIVTRDACYSRL